MPNYSDNTISQYAITDGVLSPLSPSTVPSKHLNPDSIAVTPNGAYLYVTSDPDLAVSVYSINPSTGALTYSSSSVSLTLRPLSIAIDPTGLHAYVVSSGGLEQYTINQATGALVPMTPSSFAVASGGGLNPIVVSGNISGNYYVYMLSEANINYKVIAPFAIGSTGALTPVNTLSLRDNGASQIVVGGNYVYSLNFQYPFNGGGISRYQINSSTGALTNTENTTLLGTQCNGGNMSIDPSGKYLYVLCQNFQNNIMLQYSINSANGILSLIGQLTLKAQFPSSLTVDSTGTYLYLTDVANKGLVWQYGISK